jgi:hypothetical protein
MPILAGRVAVNRQLLLPYIKAMIEGNWRAKRIVGCAVRHCSTLFEHKHKYATGTAPSRRCRSVRDTSQRIRPMSPNSDEAVFATSLDNARRCFLILKYVFLPLLLLFGAVLLILQALFYFDYIQIFSSVFFFVTVAMASVIAVPVFLTPAIICLRRVPSCFRLALVNCVFVMVCLVVPVLAAHCIWRRQYQEVNGFLLIHQFLPAAPPRVRQAVVSAHEALSICDDEFFFVLFVLDHAYMSAHPFFLPMIIELPPKYFAFFFSVYSLIFWSSSSHISDVYVRTCSNHPLAGTGAQFVKQFLPLGHMMHLVICVSYLFTRLFVVSRNREQNKIRVLLALHDAAATSKVHVEALFRLKSAHTVQPSRALFWSRTDLLRSQQKQAPLLLPASIGIAFKVSLGLKDWALYVWALGLPIYFTVFEIMRLFLDVDIEVQSVMYAYFWKCLVLLAFMIAPHYLFAHAVRQGRVPSLVFVYTGVFVVITLCVHFIKPGTTRILPRNSELIFGNN